MRKILSKLDSLTDFVAEVSANYLLTGWGVLCISLIIAIVFIIIYKNTKSRQLLNSLPGLFTSLGLLGTFLAIYNSLGDINHDKLDIDIIISELIPAFTSSIAGLIAAFLATVASKLIYAYEDKRLEGKLENKSPEECLYEISMKLSEQAKDNERYNEKLNTTIGQQSDILSKFINDFVERMDDIFTKMHGQIEQNIKDFGEEQFKQCATTLETLTSKMSTLSLGLLEQQKTNVKDMIEGTNSELRSVSNNVTTQVSSLCTEVNSALSTLSEKQNEKLTDIIKNYNELSERLAKQNSEFAEKVNSQFNEESAKLQQQSTANLQHMIKLKETFTDVNEKMLQSSTELNEKVSKELRESLSSFIESLKESVAEQIKLLSNAITTNVTQLEKSYDFISDHVANIKGNYESAAQSYIDAVNKAHRSNETQENMLSSINHSMKHVIKTNEKVDEVISIIEDRQERIENLISHINEISTTIEVLQKLETQLNRITNKYE